MLAQPLDRTNGEVLDGLDASLHVVVETSALAEMSNFRTPYWIGQGFGARMSDRPVFDDALAHAATAFVEKGALLPIRVEEGSVLVQVYPKDGKVAVVIQRMIAEVLYFVWRFYDAPPEVIDALLTHSGKKVTEH